MSHGNFEGGQSRGSHVTRPALPGPLNRVARTECCDRPDWGGPLEPDRIPSNIETFDILLFPNITDFQNPPTPILN